MEKYFFIPFLTPLSQILELYGQIELIHPEAQSRVGKKALLKNAKEITIEEKAIDRAGDVIANVYVDQISLGQELLYKFFAIRSGEPTTWCD